MAHQLGFLVQNVHRDGGLMGSYIFRRQGGGGVLLMDPTIVGSWRFSFCGDPVAPGGPVEQVIAQFDRPG